MRLRNFLAHGRFECTHVRRRRFSTMLHHFRSLTRKVLGHFGGHRPDIEGSGVSSPRLGLVYCGNRRCHRRLAHSRGLARFLSDNRLRGGIPASVIVRRSGLDILLTGRHRRIIILWRYRRIGIWGTTTAQQYTQRQETRVHPPDAGRNRISPDPCLHHNTLLAAASCIFHPKL